MIFGALFQLYALTLSWGTNPIDVIRNACVGSFFPFIAAFPLADEVAHFAHHPQKGTQTLKNFGVFFTGFLSTHFVEMYANDSFGETRRNLPCLSLLPTLLLPQAALKSVGYTRAMY